MKRSSFLLAAGISLIAMSTASVSLAAPPAPKKAKAVKTVKPKKEKEPPKKTTEDTSAASSDSSAASPASADKAKGADDAKPTQNVAQGTTPGSDVAQGDPAPAQPTPAPAPTDGSSTTPAAGTGTDTTPTPTPTLTLTGPSTTPSDTPATAPTTPPAKPKPRPFAGSALYVTTSMTTATVFRGQQQDPNPTVDSNFWFLPRYAINDAFQLRARAIVSYEYTNSDSTRYRNEPILSDTTVSMFYRKLPEILTIKPMIAVNAALPTSKASRARTLVVSPGATLQLVKQFEHVLGGDIGIISSAIYSHPLYQSRQPEVVDARPDGALQCVGGAGDCNNLSAGGVLNPSDTLAYTFLLEGEWGKWNPAVYYLGSSQWVYTPKDVTAGEIVPGGGNQTVTSGQSAGPPGVRQTHYFSVWLDYNFNSWITGEVGYWHSRTALNENGQRGNIFFDRYQDTRVYLGASIQLDNLVKTLQGGNQGEAGVVRAHNTKKPMWNF